MEWPRFLILAVLISLLAWLAMSAGRSDREWKYLQEARERGLVATLTPDQTADLISLVRVALDLTRPEQSFEVNRIADRRTLNIISYRSDVPHRWNFGLGNALYDATLDVVFVDEALIDVHRLVTPDNPKAPSPMRSFVLFAILHELGHRSVQPRFVFHRNQGFVSGTNSGSVIETAADEYALAALGRASKSASPELTAVFAEALDEGIGLECGELREAELTYCRTASALWTASQIYLIGATPFPPFYSNDAHPPLTRRAIRILEDPVLLDGLSPPLKDHAAVLREWFRRLQVVAERGARELFVDRQVDAATPTSQGWLVVSKGSYALFLDSAFSKAGVHRRLTTGAWKAIPNWDANQPFGYPYPFECGRGVWCLADLQRGVVQPLNEPEHRNRITFPDGEKGSMRPSLLPGGWLYRVKNDVLHIFWDLEWRTTRLDELQAQFANDLAYSGLSLRVLNAGPDWIGFGLVEHGRPDVLKGWCRSHVDGVVGPPECHLFEGNAWPLENKSALLAWTGRDLVLYYATSNDANTDVDVLSTRGQVIAKAQVQTHDQRIRRHHDLWMAYPSVWWGDMVVTADGSLVVSYIGDSVYRVTPAGEVSVVMHPPSLLTDSLEGGVVLVPTGASRSVYSIRWDNPHCHP